MIGKILSRLRKDIGLTQEEASKRLKIPRSTYSNYESGKREPDFETTQKLANFFGVTIGYLLGDDPQKMNADYLVKEEQSAYSTLSKDKKNEVDLKLDEMLSNMSEERKKALLDFLSKDSN